MVFRNFPVVLQEIRGLVIKPVTLGPLGVYIIWVNALNDTAWDKKTREVYKSKRSCPLVYSIAKV